MTTLSQKKLLEIVYLASQCFIPTEELTREQLEKLDNINYRLCDCWRCKKTLTSQDKSGKALGHADKETRLIGISRDAFRSMAGISGHQTGCNHIFLLRLIQTIVHEIVHVLFPEYSEERTIDKTNEWLNSFDWSQVR